MIGQNANEGDPSDYSGTPVAGPTAANSLISGTPSTPYIAGLSGGAAPYGIVQDAGAYDGNLLLLTALQGDISTIKQNAPSNAVVAVERIDLATLTGFDNYSGYDLLLYVNLTSMPLDEPAMGVSEGRANPDFAPDLQYFQGVGTTAVTMGSIGANQVFATLIPNSGSQFISATLGGFNAALAGTFSAISGQPLVAGAANALYISASFGTQTAGLQLPGLQAVTASADGKNVYALNVSQNVLVVANSDLTERQTLALTGLTANSRIVLSADGATVYVTEPGNDGLALFSRNTTTGSLTPLASQPTVALGADLAETLAVNPAGTEIAIGSPYGIQIYGRHSDGSFGSFEAQQSGFGSISQLTFSQDGNFIYAISAADNAFFVLDSTTLNIDASFTGSADGLVGASAVAVSHDDQFIYVTGEQGESLGVFQRDKSTNTFTLLQVLQQGVNGVSGLLDPNGVVVSADSSPGQPNQDKYVYVTSGLGSSLTAFARQPDGTLQQVQVLRGTQGLDDPGGLTEDGNGVVYVASQAGHGASGGGIATFTPILPDAITAASWSNNTVTITASNSFEPGQTAIIAGITGSLVSGGFDGSFTVASVIKNSSGVLTGFTYALTTNPGSATLGTAQATLGPRVFSVLFTKAMDAVTVTAGNANNVINLIHDLDVAAVNIDGGNGTNAVNVVDVPAPGLTQAAQTLTVNAGTGANEVSIFAGQASHIYNVMTGLGTDDDSSSVTLDGSPARDGSDYFGVTTGAGNDTITVAGTDLAPSDTVNVNGGAGFDTLLYNSAGDPITPGAPILPNGEIGVGSSNAIVGYSNIELIPGFVGPSYSAGGPYTINEGQSLTLNGTATAATNTQLLGISWGLTGDGTYEDAVETAVAFPATSATADSVAVTWAQLASLGLAGPGNYTIGMQVATSNGTFYAYTTLTIAATPPVFFFQPAGSTYVGEPYTVGFSAVFPGNEVATGWTVNWGDGQTTTLPSGATSATHVYTAVGSEQVTASVTDANGTYPSASRTVLVGVDPGSLSAGGPYTINAGGSLTLTATADGDPTAATWDLLGHGTYAVAGSSFVNNGNGHRDEHADAHLGATQGRWHHQQRHIPCRERESHLPHVRRRRGIPDLGRYDADRQ